MNSFLKPFKESLIFKILIALFTLFLSGKTEEKVKETLKSEAHKIENKEMKKIDDKHFTISDINFY